MSEPTAPTRDVGAEGRPEADRFGHYELIEELGRGAMARVWRARDVNLPREVAIKEPLFDPNLPQGVLDEMGRRFVQEARTAASLNHPGIVTIYEADLYGGRPAIVMELVEGATLADIIERNGALDPATALDAIDQLLDAVGYAHARGVVHRDIKPDNVFVSNDGHVKLADFGIAHVDSAEATRATVAGAVLGTPGYMSPEQARGGAVDARSDLFSVGVVAYEMLTGCHPFGAGDGTDSTTLLYRIVHEPAPEMPASAAAGLAVDVRPAIMAALAKDPASRPQSAAEFKAMLHGALPPRPAPPQPGPVIDGSDRKRPSWLLYVVVAAVCAVVVGVVLAFALQGSPAPRPDPGPHSASDSSSDAASTAAALYLAEYDGNVAVYSEDSAQPYEVTDIEVGDLTAEDVADLKSLPSFTSIDDAYARIGEYVMHAQAAALSQGSATGGGSANAPSASTATMYVADCNEFITLRSQPDTGASELNRVPLGASVSVEGPADNGFYKVSYKGQTGYCLASYLSTTNKFGYETTLLRVVNCSDWISLRTRPNTSASVIAQIPLGESARYIGPAENGFYQVSYNGDVGYALASYLTEW